MFRPLARSHRRPARRGTSILLIALIMLALFSAVGTAYVFFAMREARLAVSRKEEQGSGIPPQPAAPDPTGTINTFFGTLLYDTGNGDNDSTQLLNGLRGHSIARSMYGCDGDAGCDVHHAVGRVGLFHEDASTYTYPTGSGSNTANYGLTGDRAQFVNYT